MGSTMSWKTCLVKVMARTAAVVVSFMNAGLGGSIQPSRARNNGWLPNGIIDSNTQNIACNIWVYRRTRVGLMRLGSHNMVS